jgi:YHS domain-containing protein/putative intracellular protease/amidase
MNRRELLTLAGAAGGSFLASTAANASENSLTGQAKPADIASEFPTNRLKVPDNGPIRVAFLLSSGAQMIDYAGPWEVFQDVENPKTQKDAFKLFTVAEQRKPIKVSGGMMVVPDFDFQSAPAPHVVVIPAQEGESQAALNWIRKCARHADVVMSVCAGAFLLAKTGLLDGKPATTIAGAYKMFQITYPKVKVQREVRFVESGNLACSGGLSSGIDLALRVVVRYFGTSVADETAATMEYAGKGWLNPAETSDIYARIQKYRKPPFCPVCDSPVGKSLSTQYKGQTYYFCGRDCLTHFRATPEKYLALKGY